MASQQKNLTAGARRFFMHVVIAVRWHNDFVTKLFLHGAKFHLQETGLYGSCQPK